MIFGANVTLAIQLDCPDVPIRAGEAVRGEIVVNASRAQKCERIEIAAAWSLVTNEHPRGVPTGATLQTLGPFAWEAGAHRHRFER